MTNLLTNGTFPELKNHTNFNPNATTLEKLMLNGDSSESWIKIYEKLGRLLANTRTQFDSIDSKTVQPDVKKLSALAEWIGTMNESWDSISSQAPERLRKYLNMDRIGERGNQVVGLLKNSGVLNFDNFLTKNIQLSSDEEDVQVNSNDVQLVYGPLGLDAAVFLADTLVTYHQQLRLDHSIRYVTSDCAKSFGRTYDETRNGTADDAQTFWRQTSLLTGWEVIRRVILEENLHEMDRQKQIDLSDVFEAGLRLIYNARIDNIGFMIVVALAEV